MNSHAAFRGARGAARTRIVAPRVGRAIRCDDGREGQFDNRNIQEKYQVSVVCLALTHPSLRQPVRLMVVGSDAVNDGIVLTHYALGITGAPLVAEYTLREP